MSQPKRVLIVAYIFPPIGGAGVQRVTKFVKYLPAHGWEPSVLTVANPSVPLFDNSLASDLPPEMIIRRARTLEPGYSFKDSLAADPVATVARPGLAGRLLKGLAKRMGKFMLQPDPQILWVPQAVREGKRLLRELPHDALLATAPPFSTFLVGGALSRASGLPLVLDYRDEWDLANAYFEHQRPDRWSRAVQKRMQRWAVRRARTLVATTRCSAKALERTRDDAGMDVPVCCIYNGYDPDDFPPYTPTGRASTERYRLVYIGTLWKLTSAVPLVDAVRLLAGRRPEAAARLELVFAGRRIGSQARVLEPLAQLPVRVVEHPYVDHAVAVRLLRSADAVCVLLSDLPGASRVVPAKVFECLAARRPILAIAPRGELWELLPPEPAAFRYSPDDVAGIAECLEREIDRHIRGPALEIPPPSQPFDRRSQAGQLARVLDRLI
jgi:glycosyltransferase involved in cell wall biosynthesis